MGATAACPKPAEGSDFSCVASFPISHGACRERIVPLCGMSDLSPRLAGVDRIFFLPVNLRSLPPLTEGEEASCGIQRA